MFGTKSTAQQPAKKPTTTTSRPTTSTSQRHDQSDHGIIPLLIRIFSVLLLIFSPFFLFFMIAMIVSPSWIKSFLACNNDCGMPLPYIWPILLCFVAEVIAALLSLIFATRTSSMLCIGFAIFWSLAVIAGVILYVLAKDWIVLVSAVGLCILWIIKCVFTG